MIGTTIDGRYAIESRLGEGGMGMVYKARHVLIDKPVAIKILRKEAAQDAASVQRFIQEAKSASKINHSNIVDITDFGVLPDGHAYFVMEFLQGQTLAQAIQEGPMDPVRVCVIGAQMARGLHAAHQKGIVHRDLKPENVFLLEREGQQDVVKIVDFGIAKISGGQRLTQVGMVLGTPEYMSPEQATGAETDHRVDQYALGCIMYEMLTGIVPFLGERPAQTLTKHVFEALVPPCQRKPELNIPPSLEQIVVRTLGKKPAERYPSMRELELALTQEELELRGQRSGPSNGTNPSAAPEGMADNGMPMQAYPQQPGYPQGPYSQPQVPAYVPVYPGAQQGSMAVPLPQAMMSSGVVVAPFASGQAAAYSGPLPLGAGWPQPPQRAPHPTRDTRESAGVNRNRHLRTVLVGIAAAALAASGALSAYYLATRNAVTPGRVDTPPVVTPPDPQRGNPPTPEKTPLVPTPPVKPEVKQPKPPENIQLVIDTVPPGAKILLNGRAWPQETPAIVTQPYGVTVRLELRKKGYLPLIKTHRFDESVGKLQEVLAVSGRRKVRTPPPTKIPAPPSRTQPQPTRPAQDPGRYRPTPDKSEIRDPFGPTRPTRSGGK